MIIWPAHYHIGKAQMSLHICNLAGAFAGCIHKIEFCKHVSLTDQLKLKPACSATEANYNVEILYEALLASLDDMLCRERITKVRGCAGWSAPLLFACNKV